MTTKNYTGILIRRAQQAHVFHWQRIVSAEISGPQFGVLTALMTTPGLSQADLCSQLDLDRSTIADIVHRLVNRGLVKRARDGKDQRRYNLTLTDLGIAETKALEPKVAKLDIELTTFLTQQEHDQLHKLLLKLLGE